MKEFMLIYKGGDPDWMKNANKEQMAETTQKWGAWMGALQAKDQLVSGGSPLQYSGKSINSDMVVTDISSSELKELVTGYSVVSANNIDDATAIAKECPIFSYPGISVDVREVVKMG